ncbi:hypothetical protein, partial [Pararcticibacter amylolyticus]
MIFSIHHQAKVKYSRLQLGASNSFDFFLKFLSLTVLVVSVHQLQLCAQEIPLSEATNIIPPRPDASNLGRYGDSNLNLSSGQVDLSVPLFFLKGIGLNLPVSLSYNHLGIPVDEPSGIVGANWSCLSIGIITRAVIGLPDDEPVTGYNDAHRYVDSVRGGLYTPKSMNDPLLLAANGRLDLQPDLFSFYFNGRSGSFFYNPDSSKYYTMPYSKLRIEDYNNGFKLTDEKGFSYYFEKSSSTISDFTTPNGTQDFSSSYKSYWYLTKVVAPDGNVEFEIDYYAETANSSSQYFVQNYDYRASGGGSCVSAPNPAAFPLDRISSSITMINRRELLVSRVKAPASSLYFFYQREMDGSVKIDSISQISTDNSINHCWRFYQGKYASSQKIRLDSICYFVKGKRAYSYQFTYYPGQVADQGNKGQDHWGFYNGANNSTLVPKIWYSNQFLGKADRNPSYTNAVAGVLASVKYPTGGTTTFDYELNTCGYNVSENNPVSEPVYGSKNYFLSRSNNSEGPGESTKSFFLAEAGPVTFSTYRDNCNNRGGNCSQEPSLTQISVDGISVTGAAKKNVSKTISLSAGDHIVRIGTPNPNDYGEVSFVCNTITGYAKKKTVGGLRIKRITAMDVATGNKNIRKFEYMDFKESDRSSGIILSSPEYTYYTTTGINCIGGTLPGCSSFISYLTVSGRSNTDLYFTGGTIVSYTRVLELLGENGENGKVEHIFSYEPDNSVKSFPFSGLSSSKWKRGLPVQTTFYNSQGRVIQQEINEYLTDESKNRTKVEGRKLGFLTYCPYQNNMSRITYGDMRYISEWICLRKNIRNYFDQEGNPQSITADYTYNPSNLLMSVVKTSRSDGGQDLVYYRYPVDYYVISDDDVALRTLKQMQNKNMLDYRIEETNSYIKDGQEWIKDGLLTLYRDFNSGNLYPSVTYVTESDQLRPFTELTKVRNGILEKSSDYRVLKEFNSYTSTGKPVSLKEREFAVLSYQWGYNKQYPTSEVKNATESEFYSENFEETAGATAGAAHTGKKYYSGSYTVSWPVPNSRSYVLSYWYR